MREEESSVRVMRVRIGIRVFVMYSVISGPIINAVLH